MAEKPQSLANHVRFDPVFHFFLLPLALFTIIVAAIYLFLHPGFWSGWLVLVAIGAMIALFKIRNYALRVQDRVIRLEEQIRLLTVLPEPLRGRVAELTGAQLVGLRFASDAELPSLVARALNEKLSCADIKKAVVNWRPDYARV